MVARVPLRSRVLGSITLLTTFALATASRVTAAPDIVLANFDGGHFEPWRATGTAFGRAPTPIEMHVANAVGGGFASSLADPKLGPRARGTLESPEFTIDRDYLNFLVAGGDWPFRAAISLWIDGRVVRTTSGSGTDRLAWASWDVRAFRGRRAWIGVYDQCIEDEHGYVSVDEIALSDQPRATPAGDVESAGIRVRRQAVEAIRRHAALAAADPWRPVYHYAPPAQRMNDPNGPAWFDGWHHLFYQHMVFEGTGPAVNVHWGHARSRDLVNWETLPLAVTPEYARGEESCFSGNLGWDQRGDPVQFVTMVPYKRDTRRQIWPARPVDAEWIQWKRADPLPPVGLVPHGAPERDLKDPFPFSAGAQRFLVLTDRNIPLYEATDDRLSRWEYRGTLDEKSAECPNFFAVDGQWVYLSSPNQPVRYVVGGFDPATGHFTPRTEGRLNHDLSYYASTAYRDNRGRTILLGVSRGQKSSQAWTGVLALPRILSLGSDGRPRMQPLPELAQLRQTPYQLAGPLALGGRGEVISGLKGDTLEIIARFQRGDATAFGLKVRRSDDGRRSLSLRWEKGEFIAIKPTPTFPCRYAIPPNEEIVLHVFLDKGILDVCTGDGRVFETRVHQAPLEDLGVEAFAEGGAATLVSLEAWQMAPAQIDHHRLVP